MTEALVIRFTIPGEPIPKARGRTYAETDSQDKPIFRNGKLVMKTKTPAKTKNWEYFISLIARQAAARVGLQKPIPLGTPVILGCLFYLPIPSSWSKKKRHEAAEGTILHTAQPDLSNLLKCVEDGAENILWKNDSQIYCYGTVDGILTMKLYGREPRTEVEVRSSGDFFLTPPRF